MELLWDRSIVNSLLNNLICRGSIWISSCQISAIAGWLPYFVNCVMLLEHHSLLCCFHGGYCHSWDFVRHYLIPSGPHCSSRECDFTSSELLQGFRSSSWTINVDVLHFIWLHSNWFRRWDRSLIDSSTSLVVLMSRSCSTISLWGAIHNAFCPIHSWELDMGFPRYTIVLSWTVLCC